MIPTIIVYNKSSNLNSIRLLDNGSPVKLHRVTKMELRLGPGAVVSSVDYPLAFLWKQAGKYQELPDGVVDLYLGQAGIFMTKTYNSEFFVFDEYNSSGVFWGYIRIRAIEEN